MTDTPPSEMNIPDSFPDKERWEIIIHDYKISWEYYKINLEERARIYNRFFQTIALPGSIITAIFAIFGFFSKSIDTNISEKNKSSLMIFDSNYVTITISGVLFIFFLAGLSMFILHCYEERVSKDYLAFINKVRTKISIDYPDMVPFLKIGYVIRHKNQKILGGTASSWRIETMSILNSLIFLFSIMFLATTLSQYFNFLNNDTLMFISYPVIYAIIWLIHRSIQKYILKKI